MKSLMIFCLLLAACSDKREYKVMRVYDTECIKQCSHSFWTSAFDQDKFSACNALYKNKPCCVYVTANSGDNFDDKWSVGETGRMTACQVEAE